MKTKIGIDARFYGPKGKGLGRYVQKLLQYLEEVDTNSEREYYVFLLRENFNLFQPQSQKFKKIIADYRWYSFGEQIFYPRLLNQYQLDLMHFTHFNVPLFYRRKFVVTLHDLILFHYPTVRNTTLNKYYYYFKLAAYRQVIKSAANRAQKVIAVSQFTKKDVVNNLKVSDEKVVVTLEGCDPPVVGKFSVPLSSVLHKYGIIKPYLLYVGNAYPHKNLERLCESFALVRKKHPSIELVLVGGKDYFYQRLGKFIQRQQIEGVKIIGFVPDEELACLYQEALLYVFPSLYEGFGLPPLEALAHGLAVASSSRTSMPEVLAQAAYYFDPEKVDSMADSLDNLIKSEKTRQEIIINGAERIKKFSWEKMARETLAIYEEMTK